MEIKDDAGFVAALTPEQKTYFETARPTWETSAVTAAEEARKKAVPEKYEFKPIDGSPLDPKEDVEGTIAAYARENHLSMEAAQKHLEHINAVAAGLVARNQKAAEAAGEAQAKEFAAQVAVDKDLGGMNAPKVAVNIERALKKFGSESFATLVNDAGSAKHPELVRFLNAVGAALAEDKPLGGGGPTTTEQKPIHERLYPNLKAS